MQTHADTIFKDQLLQRNNLASMTIMLNNCRESPKQYSNEYQSHYFLLEEEESCTIVDYIQS